MRRDCGKSSKEGRQTEEEEEEEEECLKGFLRCDLLVSVPVVDRMSLHPPLALAPGPRRRWDPSRWTGDKFHQQMSRPREL